MEAVIELIVFISGKRIRRSTGISVKPIFWNSKKERVKESQPDSDELNLMLNDLQARVNAISMEYRLRNKLLTPEDFINEYDHGNKRLDFILYFQHRRNSRVNAISSGTMKNHLKTEKLLQRYANQILFHEITNGWMLDFKRFMEIEGMQYNTYTTYLKIVKQYLNAAKKDGIELHEDIFKGISLRDKQGDRVALSADELKRCYRLYQSESLKPKLQKVLRCFLFSAFTGLRLSDAKRAKRSWVQDGQLVFTPNKTSGIGKKLRVPVSDRVIELLPEDGSTIPFISDQKTNDYLKEVMRGSLGINKEITFHCARHTYASVHLEVGGSVETLQKLLGHSDIKQTMVYVHVSNQRAKKEVDLVSRFLGD